MALKSILFSFLATHKIVLAFVGLISFFSLAAAFIAEIFFALEPCQLCIYQRYPFAFALLISLISLTIFRKSNKILRISIMLCALGMLVNAGIAFYHTGIEQH